MNSVGSSFFFYLFISLFSVFLGFVSDSVPRSISLLIIITQSHHIGGGNGVKTKQFVRFQNTRILLRHRGIVEKWTFTYLLANKQKSIILIIKDIKSLNVLRINTCQRLKLN